MLCFCFHFIVQYVSFLQPFSLLNSGQHQENQIKTQEGGLLLVLTTGNTLV